MEFDIRTHLLTVKLPQPLQFDPFPEHLFLFMNARRSPIKRLYYDGTALILICGRLE